MTSLHITEEAPDILAELAAIPMSFVVESVLEPQLDRAGLGGIALILCRLDRPYRKDYDVDSGEGPMTWSHRFDLSNWGILAARDEGRCVGSAVVAWQTPELTMLEGRADIAVLWDLRIAPDVRRRGLGRALVRSCEAWASARDCVLLKVETQNVMCPHVISTRPAAFSSAESIAMPIPSSRMRCNSCGTRACSHRSASVPCPCAPCASVCD